MKITDEAVQAAQAECRRQAEKYNWYSWPSEESMRSIVTAALPHLPAGCKIKQLEWTWDPHERCHYAKTPVGLFKVDRSKSLFLGTCLLSRKFKKTAEAKAAAQAEFDDIVRGCIICTLIGDGTKLDTKELIQALSRLAGNRHSDGVSSLVSAGDRSTIINTCHDLIFALKTSDTVDVAALEAKHDKEMTEVIKERDQAEAWADKLAYAIGGEGIGEHSSINNPWENALEIAETRKPVDVAEVRNVVEKLIKTADEVAFHFGDNDSGFSIPSVNEADYICTSIGNYHEARAKLVSLIGDLSVAQTKEERQ